MGYHQSFKDNILNLRKFLLGEISFEEFEKGHEKLKESYEIVFESEDFKEFSKKMYDFFSDKEMVKNRLEHEKEHADLSKKHGFEVKFVLKSYERDGKTRYRPSILEKDSDKIKKAWSKKKLWQYYFDQVDRKDASDNDKLMKEMLLDIKEIVFRQN